MNVDRPTPFPQPADGRIQSLGEGRTEAAADPGLTRFVLLPMAPITFDIRGPVGFRRSRRAGGPASTRPSPNDWMRPPLILHELRSIPAVDRLDVRIVEELIVW
jgi:hypothetical protein